MGTNFYLNAGHCDSCGRADRVHIGKRSLGWSFSWQGYRDEAWPGQWKVFSGALDTATAWGVLLRTRGVGLIEDEYGTTHDIEAFLDMVAEVNAKARHTVGNPQVSGPFWRANDPDHVEQPDRSTVSFCEFT